MGRGRRAIASDIGHAALEAAAAARVMYAELVSGSAPAARHHASWHAASSRSSLRSASAGLARSSDSLPLCCCCWALLSILQDPIY